MSIEINNLTKRFGNCIALDDISLTFENNKIYGLFGRNGVGKTTLLNIVNNREFPTSGEILIDGKKAKNSDEIISKTYLTSEKTLFPRDMKIKDIFKWSKNYNPDFDTEKAFVLAEQFGLNISKKSSHISTGQASIVKLILGLCINAEYVFFDEPVNGLDANNRELFYKLLIEKYIESPCTFVISTHLIDEIANLVEKVIILDRGKVIINKTRDEILDESFAISGKAEDVDSYISDREIIATEVMGPYKTAYIYGRNTSDVPENLEISKPDLQKLFIKLTNQKEELR